MKHFKLCVAGLYVTVSARFALAYDICRPYLTDMPWSDITLYARPHEIEQKKKSFPMPITDEQAECIVLSDQLSLKLLPFDAFVLHAAVIEYSGRAYAFCAPRGVGKTTHVRMWQQAFGADAVRVINGDKPIVRRAKDGRFYAWGTPFRGKELLGATDGVPLDCITFIERGQSNAVSFVNEREYLDRLIGQVVFPADERSMKKGAVLLADFMRATPAAVAQCNMEPTSASSVHQFWN